MRSNRREESRDATTVFVSLALCLLVLFAYLNAAAMPSQALLNRAVSSSTELMPTDETKEVGIPEELTGAVAYYRTRGRSAGRPGEVESSILIDRRALQNTDQSSLNQEQLTKLFSWITAKSLSHNISTEITCFIGADTTEHEIGERLINRARQCEALGLFNDAKIPAQFNARQPSAEITKIASAKAIDTPNLLLITLRRSDGRR